MSDPSITCRLNKMKCSVDIVSRNVLLLLSSSSSSSSLLWSPNEGNSCGMLSGIVIGIGVVDSAEATADGEAGNLESDVVTSWCPDPGSLLVLLVSSSVATVVVVVAVANNDDRISSTAPSTAG